MLPDITRLLQEMQALGQRLAAMQERTEAVNDNIRGNGSHNPGEDAPLAQSIRQLETALKNAATQFAEWQIEVKDLRVGLIDFPALRAGRTVLLCWKLGEPRVAFWHEIETGFQGRQPRASY